jgi:hypothetical protein
VDLLQGVEEGLEGGAAKVGDRAQASEQTPVQYLLEVPLTDVLKRGRWRKVTARHYQGQLLVRNSAHLFCLAGSDLPAW